MARWRLMAAHYLNTIDSEGNPTEWEYKENDQATGKQRRKLFPVPQLLDPQQPGDFNYPGEIIVTNDQKSTGKDIIFLGDPTPDMEPIDDEARQISASFANRWKHPIDSLSGDYSQSLIKDFEVQMAEAIRKAGSGAPSPVSAGQVSKEDFEALQKQVADLLAQNQALAAAAAVPAGARRI